MACAVMKIMKLLLMDVLVAVGFLQLANYLILHEFRLALHHQVIGLEAALGFCLPVWSILPLAGEAIVEHEVLQS